MSFLNSVGSTLIPSVSESTFIYISVSGCSNIMVFIAGATMNGNLLRSQQRATQVNKLSHRPFASLPMVLADRGAISRRDANFLSSMCKTLSSLLVQQVHSSWSVNCTRMDFPLMPEMEYSGKSRKCCELFVEISTTFRSSEKRPSMISLALILATDPDTPNITVLNCDYLSF